MKQTTLLTLVALLGFGGWTAYVSANQSAAVIPPVSVDFSRDIRPLFEKHCYSCHGPENQMALLRLDSRSIVFKGGVSGPAVIPGKGMESLLYQRVVGLGGNPQMPLSGDKLTVEQIGLILKWIDQGAVWPENSDAIKGEVKKHWAYEKPKRYPFPTVKNLAWVRNPIDRFILAKLETEGLNPSSELSKEKLLRRVSLDLIGLPPTLEELDAYLSDQRPDAYERAVDRLLSSPQYGERWAKPWLDLSRYADTQGYEKDDRRIMWPYRDWVIKALNRDMPFDQFTIEQIAGDLLPNATLEQKVATGFHRNTMINEEGGTDPEEFRIAAVLDRVNTTATVWLGSTLACAQCHNHKYDPFTQEEYYRFVAFFNNTEDEVFIDRRNSEVYSRGPSLNVPSPPALAETRRRLEDEVFKLGSLLQTATPELERAQADWEHQTKGQIAQWVRLRPRQLLSLGNATLSFLPDNSVLVSGKNPDQDTFVILADTPLEKITAIRLEALTDESLPRRSSSRSPDGNFLLTELEFEAAPLKSAGSPQTVEFLNAVADYSQRDHRVRDAIDGDPATGWAIDGDKENFQVDRQAVFIPKQPFGFTGGTRMRVRLRHDSVQPQHVVGRFRLSVSSLAEPESIVELPVTIQSILNTPVVSRTTSQRKLLAQHYRSVAPLLKEAREQLERKREELRQLTTPSTLVMKELPQPRPTYVHVGGSFLNKGKAVIPGVPAVLPPLPKDQPANRLTLARWLVDKENPLVGRVTVNRFWNEIFGNGMVDTPEDFGSRCDPPSHPELLDWLSAEFMEKGWSMKSLLRLIVTSAAYRQDSRVTPELLEKDPYNRLLSRGPRLRLPAELIRDTGLAVSGLLSPKMGGPGVFPPQPEGIWTMIYSDDKWVTSTGEDRYRRGIYTFWRRTAPYPAFTTFDAPSRESCTVRRVRTDTPLQSLTTLNDPAYVDMARGLARRLLTSGGPTPEAKINQAFRLCVSRAPSDLEFRRILDLYRQEFESFKKSPEAAQRLASEGDVSAPKNANLLEFATWTVVANVMLNLDETLTKG